MKILRFLALTVFFVASPASAQWQVGNHAVPLGKGAGVIGFGSAAPGPSGYLFGSTGTNSDPAFVGFTQSGTGAATRTWQDKLRERISVMDFGAACNGTTDDTQAFIRGRDAAVTKHAILYVPGGTCVVTSEIAISTNAFYIQGEGSRATFIKFAPTAPGNLFKWSNGSNSVFSGGMAGLTLTSDNSTLQKTAILLKDARDFQISDVQITGGVVVGPANYWSGNNSIGLLYQGRDGLITHGLIIAADRPMVWQSNPNNSISIDTAQFNKTQLIANAHPCIEAEAGVTASRISFLDLWCGLGTHGFYSNGSTTAQAWQEITFQNFGLEQGTNAAAYNVYLASTTHLYQGIVFNNVLTDGARKGFYFRNVNGVQVSNVIHGGANELFNFDSTDTDVHTFGINAAGASQTISGLVSNYVAKSPSYSIPRTALYTNTVDKFGVNVLTPVTTFHVGNSGVAAGSEATNHGVVQVDSGQVDAAANGVEWKASTGGSGYGFRAATVFDGAANIDFILQARQNSAAWTNAWSIKGSDGSANILSGILNVAGSSSGLVSIKTQAAAGTYNFNLPTSAGAAGECLKSGGGGAAAQTYGACSGGTVNTVATTTNATFYPLFVASSVDGTQVVNLAAGFSFNPNTNTLGLAALNASGQVSGATIAGTTGNFTTNNSATYNASDAYTFTAGVTAYKTGSFASVTQTASTGAAPFNASGALILQSRGNADRDIYFVTGSTPAIRATIAGATGDTSLSSTTDASSSVTGSFNTAGGIGVAKAAWIGTYASIGTKIRAGGSAPTISAGCNGAGSSISGSDLAGTVTGQTAAATTCTITFNAAYASTPYCTASGLTSPLTGAITPSTTTLVVNFASTANYQFTYQCFARSGG